MLLLDLLIKTVFRWAFVSFRSTYNSW